MALIFIDGFDHYTPAVGVDGLTRLRGKCALLPPSTTLVPGRRTGSSALHLRPHVSGATPESAPNTGYWRTMPTQAANLTLGAAVRWGPETAFLNSTTVLLGIKSSNAAGGWRWCEVSMSAADDGRLVLRSPIGTLFSTTQRFAPGLWYYIELQVVQNSPINTANGTATLRVNGVQVAHMTGINMLVSAQDALTQVVYAGARPNTNVNVAVTVDDLYVVDSLGTFNNTFLGDVRVDTLLPSSDGTNVVWDVSPPQLAAWQALSDTNDATAVRTTTLGARQTTRLAVPPMPFHSIFGTQINLLADRDGTTAVNARGLVTHGGETTLGPSIPLTDDRVWSSTVVERDPVAAAIWTPSSLATAEFGVEAA